MRSAFSRPKAGTVSASRPRMETSTMTKSRMFQPSRMYAVESTKCLGVFDLQKPIEQIFARVSDNGSNMIKGWEDGFQAQH